MMLRYVNRAITVMIIATAGIIMGGLATQVPVAFADEGQDQTVLEVYYDDVLMHGYTRGELEQIALGEGNNSYLTYDFSAMNTYPTPELLKGVTGPTVDGVISDAFDKSTETGIPSGIDKLDPDQLIFLRENKGNNAYNAVYTVKQLLLDERYYYPNVKNETWRNGAPALQDSYTGEKKVPAILSLTEPDVNKAGRLLVGQYAPHEQNQQDWVQGMIRTTTDPGQIIVQSTRAGRLNPVTKTDAGDGGKVVFGKAITFDRSVNEFQPAGGKRYWIYYTTDGTEPTRKSTIYNCNNFDFGESYEVFNKPSISKDAGQIRLRIKVFGNGKLDSETTDFSLQGVEEESSNDKPKETPKTPSLAAPKPVSVTSPAYNSATIRWKRVSGATGYEVYRAVGNGSKYSLHKRITGNKVLSMTDANIMTGTKHCYKVRAFAKTASGTTVFGPFSNVAGTVPVLTGTSISKLKVKKKTVSLQWKTVAGASGYQIWRAEKKKTGKYKVVRTIQNGKTITWKNKGLKKGKKYFYKIRAYRVVKGKRVYSSFSAVKYIKAK